MVEGKVRGERCLHVHALTLRYAFRSIRRTRFTEGRAVNVHQAVVQCGREGQADAERDVREDEVLTTWGQVVQMLVRK